MRLYKEINYASVMLYEYGFVSIIRHRHFYSFPR